jgi:hypothetical protein
VRFVVITRLLSPVPPEQLPSIMERFADWRAQYAEHMQSFEFFAGGGGGFMVLDTPDEIVLNRIMAEYPFAAYLDVEVRPIIDGDTGLAQWWQVMRQMLGDSEGWKGPPEKSSITEPPSPQRGHRKLRHRVPHQMLPPRIAGRFSRFPRRPLLGSWVNRDNPPLLSSSNLRCA